MAISIDSDVARDVQTAPIQVIPTGAVLGAEVSGVDLRDDTARRIMHRTQIKGAQRPV